VEWIEGPGYVRHASAIVLMELSAATSAPRTAPVIDELRHAAEVTGRLHAPSRGVWQRAGVVLRQLRAAGFETRRASLVNDVLIALSARELGATLVTRDASDHAAIAKYVDYAVAYIE
jgi:predicted nucleic acid-binding protein